MERRPVSGGADHDPQRLRRSRIFVETEYQKTTPDPEGVEYASTLFLFLTELCLRRDSVCENICNPQEGE
jgi:hypothetical protein